MFEVLTIYERSGKKVVRIVKSKSKISEVPGLELSPPVTVSNAEVSEEEAPDLDQVLDSVAVVVVDDTLLNALKANENKTGKENKDSSKDDSDSTN